MNLLSIPRILISSDRSSSGKTTISIGLMKTLSEMGYSVQPFKVALDYIDPEYHTEVTGRYGRNLDGYLMNDEKLIDVFIHGCKTKDKFGREADIAIIEGVRGLFEGLDSINDIGSTAQIAKILDTPILFVINAKSITKSCAAIVKGFSSIDSELNINGIILNNIGSEKHAKKAIEAIKYYTSIPVVGVIYRNENIKLIMQSLGLKSIPEQHIKKVEFSNKINNLSNHIKNNVDIEKIISIAKNSNPLKIKKYTKNIFENNINKKITIGIAYDEAFNFYYKDNLDLFEVYGAKIKLFSVLHDKVIPNNIDALYIGSGNIEYFLKELEENESMKTSIKIASESGMPIYGESSGMNYLTQEIILDNRKNKKKYNMVGALPGTTLISNDNRIVTYTDGEFINNSIIGNIGDKFKGHEYHNTQIINLNDNEKYSILINRGKGITNMKDGLIKNNTIGTYVQFHGISYELWIQYFIGAAEKYREKKYNSYGRLTIS